MGLHTATRVRYLLFVLALSIILALVFAPFPKAFSSCGLRGFGWTEYGRVARAAQPSVLSFACLWKMGFGAVVNLRHENPGYNEGTVVTAFGMQYLLVPIVNDTAPRPAQVTEYMGFMADRARSAPVLVHDAAGRGRMGIMDGIYLLWKGWPTDKVFGRYIDFGAKIDCKKGGNGQVQALHEIGLILGRGDAWPRTDEYGNAWTHCPRPDYMATWDYSTVEFPPYAHDSNAKVPIRFVHRSPMNDKLIPKNE